MSDASPRTDPVWLLDIDGVVNALARTALPTSWPESAWVVRTVVADIPGQGVMRLPIVAARPVLDFVRRIHDSGMVEIRWHSTWRAAAVTDLAPALGLPDVPISVAPEWTDRPIARWWKLPAAERVVAAGRRLVWTDDDLPAFAGELDGLAARPDVLLIAPRRETGLLPEHLDRIESFLGATG